MAFVISKFVKTKDMPPREKTTEAGVNIIRFCIGCVSVQILSKNVYLEIKKTCKNQTIFEP